MKSKETTEPVTKEKWEKIMAKASAGDPIKDVIDLGGLLDLCMNLRVALEKLCKAHEEVCPSGAKCETLRFCKRVLERGQG